MLLLFLLLCHFEEGVHVHDALLDILGGLSLVDLLLHLGHFILVEEILLLLVLDPGADQELKLVHDLSLLLDNLVTELNDHPVGFDVVEERVRDALLSSFFVVFLLEYFGKAVPPSTELLGRIQNISVELLQLSLELFSRWVESDIGDLEGTRHLDQEWLLIPAPEGLVGGECADNHLGDGVEDPSLPVGIVWSHCLGLAITGGTVLYGGLLNTLEVIVTDELVVLDEVCDFSLSMGFEEVCKLRDVHGLNAVEVNLSDDDGVFNLVDLLLDVLGVAHHVALGLLEGVDGSAALLDVLIDRKGEPIVVLETFIHVLVELLDVIAKKSALDWPQIDDSLLIASKKLIELVNVAHVVFLLESDVHDCLRNGLADSAKELGLSDHDLEFGGEVDSVLVVFTHLLSDEDVLLEELDGLVGVCIAPLHKGGLLVVLVELLGKFDVLGGHIFEDLTEQLI